jgi:hypothetical protein
MVCAFVTRFAGNLRGIGGIVLHGHVADIEKDFRALLDAGTEAQQGPRDVGGGTMAASVKDADGNVIWTASAGLRGRVAHREARSL